MRIIPPIKMHNDFEKEYVVYRERLFTVLSLDPALCSESIEQQYQWDRMESVETRQVWRDAKGE